MNFVTSRLERADGGATVSIGSQKVQVSKETVSNRPELERFLDKEVIVGLRPQDFQDARFASDGDATRFQATVDLVEALGTQTLIHFEVDTPPVQTEEMKELAEDAGAGEGGLSGERAQFVAEVDPKSQVERGHPVELSIDTTQLHFFDPETGSGIYGSR
jgi:multiple sugar transport system ATP-binding protein